MPDIQTALMSGAGQVHSVASVPTDMQTGFWSVHWIPLGSDTASGDRVLYGTSGAEFVVVPDAGGGGAYLEVRVSAVVVVNAGPFTYSALQGAGSGEGITFQFSSATGVVEISGATTGNGLYYGAPWTVADGTLHIGRGASGSPCEGYISAPFPGSGEVPEVTIAAILGDRLRWRSDAEPGSYLLGTSPDVQTLYNNAVPGLADVTQGPPASRPHLATVDGLQVFRFDGTQDLEGGGGENVLSAGDFPTIWVIARTRVTTGVRGFFEASADGVNYNEGVICRINSGVIGCGFDTPTGTPVPSYAHTDTERLHLIQATLTADGASISVDGVPGTPVSISNTGMQNNLPYITVGAFATGLRLDGDIHEIIIARDVSPGELAQINAILLPKVVGTIEQIPGLVALHTTDNVTVDASGAVTQWDDTSGANRHQVAVTEPSLEHGAITFRSADSESLAYTGESLDTLIGTRPFALAITHSGTINAGGPATVPRFYLLGTAAAYNDNNVVTHSQLGAGTTVWTHDGTNLAVRHNGVELDTAVIALSSLAGNFSLGSVAGQYMDGQITAYALFDATHWGARFSANVDVIDSQLAWQPPYGFLIYGQSNGQQLGTPSVGMSEVDNVALGGTPIALLNQGTALYTANLAAASALVSDTIWHFWSQGESDADGDGSKAAAYPSLFSELITDWESDIPTRLSPHWLVELIHPDGSPTHTGLIRVAQAEVAATFPRVHLIDNSDRALTDGAHYSTGDIALRATRYRDMIAAATIVEGVTHAIHLDAHIHTLGTGTEVASAASLEGAALTVSQATPAQRPDYLTTCAQGIGSWRFTRSDSQSLAGTMSEAVAAAAEVSMWLVFQLASTPVDTQGLVHLHDGTAASGLRIWHDGADDTIRCGVYTASAGEQTRSASLSDTAALHVLRVTVDSDGVTMRLDTGAESTVAVTTGGVGHPLDRLVIGADHDEADNFADAHILSLRVIANPSAADIRALDTYHSHKHRV